MKKAFDKIYQFKILLNRSKPPIWRRIQVPETYTFWDLHVAIQDSFGWLDYHLHEFEILSPKLDLVVNIGFPNDEYGEEIFTNWEEKIIDYFSMENKRSLYTYDFGDNWEHIITLEKILPRNKEVKYPICIKGKRACPPEDCGGIWGYEELLAILQDPNHEEYKETLEWVGNDFNPEYFNKDEINFEDPRKRLKIAINES